MHEDRASIPYIHPHPHSHPYHDISPIFLHPNAKRGATQASIPNINKSWLVTAKLPTYLRMFSPSMSWEIGFDLGMASFTADASTCSIPIPPEEPPLKRRKTQLACNCCRMRKTRCDGKRPICSPCERRGSGDDCLYEEGTLYTRKYVVSPRAPPKTRAAIRPSVVVNTPGDIYRH